MKNTNRIRPKASDKAAAQQGKTPSDTSSAKIPTFEDRQQEAIKQADKFTVVCFASHQGELDDIGGAELSRAEFAAIQQDAAARGETLNEWFIRTLDETPALQLLKGNGADESLPSLYSPADELDSAIAQAQGLNTLLEHHVLNSDEGLYSVDVRSGISVLSQETFNRLRRANEAVFKATLVKGGGR